MTEDKNIESIEIAVEKSKNIIGELVLFANAIDSQLNEVCFYVLFLEGNKDKIIIEAIIAAIDCSRKIELLKNRVKHFPDCQIKPIIKEYIKKIENVNKYRNVAAHSYLSVKNGVAVLLSDNLIKIYNTVQKETLRYDHVNISNLEDAIIKAQETHKLGCDIINAFSKRLSLLKSQNKII